MVMAGVKAAGPGSKMFSRPFLVRLQELHERLKASDRNGTCIFVGLTSRQASPPNSTLTLTDSTADKSTASRLWGKVMGGFESALTSFITAAPEVTSSKTTLLPQKVSTSGYLLHALHTNCVRGGGRGPKCHCHSRSRCKYSRRCRDTI